MLMKLSLAQAMDPSVQYHQMPLAIRMGSAEAIPGLSYCSEATQEAFHRVST